MRIIDSTISVAGFVTFGKAFRMTLRISFRMTYRILLRSNFLRSEIIAGFIAVIIAGLIAGTITSFISFLKTYIPTLTFTFFMTYYIAVNLSGFVAGLINRRFFFGRDSASTFTGRSRQSVALNTTSIYPRLSHITHYRSGSFIHQSRGRAINAGSTKSNNFAGTISVRKHYFGRFKLFTSSQSFNLSVKVKIQKLCTKAAGSSHRNGTLNQYDAVNGGYHVPTITNTGRFIALVKLRIERGRNFTIRIIAVKIIGIGIIGFGNCQNEAVKNRLHRQLKISLRKQSFHQ
ncbi:MAG: hypothetical protein DBX65_01455 [Oscillospiraceae bacterium]|nr:MAG: hypothetical protein DBX65_01455 [Oscillospiraceae bacterium]